MQVYRIRVKYKNPEKVADISEIDKSHSQICELLPSSINFKDFLSGMECEIDERTSVKFVKHV